MKRRRRGEAALLTCISIGAIACAAASTLGDGLEPSTLPAELRDDYALFAQRCSKCHSLSRPLNSGITDEDYWQLYVARMRRQPGSGISQDDAAPILRFLHFYSIEQQQKKEKGSPSPSSAPVGHVPGRPRF